MIIYDQNDFIGIHQLRQIDDEITHVKIWGFNPDRYGNTSLAMEYYVIRSILNRKSQY